MTGATFRVGREAVGEYNESLNGYRLSNQGHEFTVPIDPFDAEGKPLPLTNQWNSTARAGQADGRVQSYNFRLCVTKVRLTSERIAHYVLHEECGKQGFLSKAR